MSLVDRSFRGGLFGLIFFACWLLVEGVYLSFDAGQAPLWSAPFNLGVVAPLAVLGALGTSLLYVCWGELMGGVDPLVCGLERARCWLVEGTPVALARRSAWLLTLPMLVGVWFVVALEGGEPIMNTIKTPAFAYLLFGGVLFAAAIFLALISPLFVVSIAWVLRLPRRVFGRLRPAPAYVLAAMGALGAAGFAAAWTTFSDVLPHLPWHFALGPLVGLLAAAATLVAVARRGRGERRTRLALAGVLAAVVGLGFFTAYMPQALSEARAVFVGQSAVGSTWYGVLDERLDHDGDGELHLFGGNDCAPYDASVNPSAREIVNNDFDENCSGADLTVDLEEFSTGQTSHPRPGLYTKGGSKKPHILLVTTDALSHTHTSLGGYKRDTTPELAEWAERATVFDNGFAHSSGTRLALPGLLAGQYNSMLPMKKARVHPYPWDGSVETIASVLKKQGYRTVFIPGDDYLFPKKWRGIGRGFDLVDTSVAKKAKDKSHTAPELTDRAIELIGEHKDGRKPLFLWVHYFDHHGPYEMPEGEAVFADNGPVDRYDNELRFADRHWGRLFEAVERDFAPEDYMLVFTSDHGELFDKDHPGGRRHGYTLATGVLHVPLIIQGPKQRGERVDGLVSHADVLPTVANVVGAEPDPDWVGESLVPVLFDGEAVDKDMLFSLYYIPEAIKRGRDGFWKHGLRTDEFYYLEDRREGSREMFEWKEDPKGENNLAETLPEQFELLRYVAAEKLEWLQEREKALSHLRE